MGNQDLNILAVAHREFMEQMTDVLTPFLLTAFDDMYDKAGEEKGKGVMKRFQAYVKDIKSWNQGMIVEHTNAIEASCGHFKNLLAMLFVGYVKILSSVRLRDSDKQKIPIKLPKPTDFVYAIYKEVARSIYKDPYWISELDDEDKVDRMEKLLNEVALPNVIKSMSPMAKILETNMGTNIPTDVEMGAASDGEDPEVISDDEGEPQPPPAADLPEAGPQAEAGGIESGEAGEEDDEDLIKGINVTGHNHLATPEVGPSGASASGDDEDDDLNVDFPSKKT